MPDNSDDLPRAPEEVAAAARLADSAEVPLRGTPARRENGYKALDDSEPGIRRCRTAVAT
jgi:hypothetical protein